MKEYEQKLELAMRRTNDLKAHIVQMAQEDVVYRINHTRSMIRELATLSDKVLICGLKHKFDMVSLKKSRVRSMLRLKTADAAFQSLQTLRPETAQSDDSALPNRKLTLGDGGKRISLTTLYYAKLAARKLVQAVPTDKRQRNKDRKNTETLQAAWARNERHILSRIQEAEPNRTASILKALNRSKRSFKDDESHEGTESGNHRVMEWHALPEEEAIHTGS
jgi:hypothetical protein